MTGPLFDHLGDIRARIAAARRVLLFLDFDGTLAPIVDIPENASLPEETRDILVRLNAGGRFRVALISGRSLEDIRQRIGLPDLIYAGNHGLEISGPGLRFAEPVERNREALFETSKRLSADLRHIPGAQVEYKGLTASVHYRRAPQERWPEIRQAVESAVTLSGDLLVMRAGRKVYEILPNVHWNKGLAVNWIRRALRMCGDLTLYLGDDTTDEHAFSALPDSVTVKVGAVAGTAANYFVDGPDEVRKFLFWLVEIEEAHATQEEKL
jgi:trehalose 6-phosphate phosphatase